MSITERFRTKLFISGTRMLSSLQGTANIKPVFTARKKTDCTNLSSCAELYFQYHRANWTPNSLEITAFQVRFWHQIRKNADNDHTDSLFQLLCALQIFADDNNDIPAFHLAEENYLDLYYSTITCDRSTIDNEKNRTFLQTIVQEYDHVLALQDAHNKTYSSPN